MLLLYIYSRRKERIRKRFEGYRRKGRRRGKEAREGKRGGTGKRKGKVIEEGL
jgi:hypothetical protein